MAGMNPMLLMGQLAQQIVENPAAAAAQLAEGGAPPPRPAPRPADLNTAVNQASPSAPATPAATPATQEAAAAAGSTAPKTTQGEGVGTEDPSRIDVLAQALQAVQAPNVPRPQANVSSVSPRPGGRVSPDQLALLAQLLSPQQVQQPSLGNLIGGL